MKVKFIPSEEFMRQFKRLAKKYPSLVSDYDTFKKELHENPFQGSDLGSGTRKVRMAIASKGKGKSGGARVITFNVVQHKDDSIEISNYSYLVYTNNCFSPRISRISRIAAHSSITQYS